MHFFFPLTYLYSFLPTRERAPSSNLYVASTPPFRKKKFRSFIPHSPFLLVKSASIGFFSVQSSIRNIFLYKPALRTRPRFFSSTREKQRRRQEREKRKMATKTFTETDADARAAFADEGKFIPSERGVVAVSDLTMRDMTAPRLPRGPRPADPEAVGRTHALRQVLGCDDEQCEAPAPDIAVFAEQQRDLGFTRKRKTYDTQNEQFWLLQHPPKPRLRTPLGRRDLARLLLLDSTSCNALPASGGGRGNGQTESPKQQHAGPFAPEGCTPEPDFVAAAGASASASAPPPAPAFSAPTEASVTIPLFSDSGEDSMRIADDPDHTFRYRIGLSKCVSASGAPVSLLTLGRWDPPEVPVSRAFGHQSRVSDPTNRFCRYDFKSSLPPLE